MEEGPKILTVEEITSIFESGDFEQFKGARETEIFEAKPTVDRYDFSLGIKNIANFAEDIASFTNCKGGYIIIGLDAPPDTKFPHDIVIGLKPFPEKDFYFKTKLSSMLKETIYKIPREPFNITAKWYPSKTDNSEGLGVIFIPKQPEDEKWFFACINKYNGEEIQRNYFGVPIREEEQTRWLKINEIYSLTKKTLTPIQKTLSELSNKIDDISNKIDKPIGKKPIIEIPSRDVLEEELNKRIKYLYGGY